MHAVAIGGDPEKMRLIYKDFQDRKQKELRASAKQLAVKKEGLSTFRKQAK